jgi:hypothetical protein
MLCSLSQRPPVLAAANSVAAEHCGTGPGASAQIRADDKMI